MSQIDHGYQIGLLSFIRASTLLRLASRMGSLDPKRIGRLTGILAGSAAAVPLATWQHLRHHKGLNNQPAPQAPVFIVGHWRSGTTHLHNLLSQDSQFDSLRMFQALAPDCSLATQAWLPKLLERLVPSKRPMDNMEWPMDAPQEEEIPLAKVTPYSWYLQFLFPQDAQQIFSRYVMLEGAPKTAYYEVQRKLLQLIKVASVHAQHQRLLLKNPVNTARIPMLRQLFPDARFIYLHRDPFEVFPSTINLHKRILELTALQRYDDSLVETNVLNIYPQLLQRYLADTATIPTNRLVEVGYADLVQNPVQTLGSIYQQLELDGFSCAKPTIEHYLESQAGYQKNRFTPLSARTEELINTHWQPAFSRWGYEPRNPTLLDAA